MPAAMKFFCASHTNAEMSLCAESILALSFACAGQAIRTTFNLKRLLTISFVPESDHAVSSCGRDNVTWRIVGALKARDFLVHILASAIRKHIQRGWIEKA